MDLNNLEKIKYKNINVLKNKEDIIFWLDYFKIKNYELVKENNYFLVNVNDNVKLYKKDVKEIPIIFNIIKGYFEVSYIESPYIILPKIIYGNLGLCFKNKPKLIYDDIIVKGDVYSNNKKILSNLKIINEKNYLEKILNQNFSNKERSFKL